MEHTELYRNVVLVIKELNSSNSMGDVKACMQKRGYDLSDDELLSICETLRDKHYIDFSIRRVAGGRWKILRPLQIRITGIRFLHETRPLAPDETESPQIGF